MNFKLKEGEKVKIALRDGNLFKGTCQACKGDILTLRDIVDLLTNSEISESLNFYGAEIISLQYLEDNDNKLPNSTSDVISPHAPNDIALGEAECKRFLSITENHVYLTTMDKDYEDAILHLNNSEVIAVACLGLDFERTKPIDLLVMSTCQHVYIFDLPSFQCNSFPEDLRLILEHLYIEKVGHGLAKLRECLWCCYQLRMKNIFDTQFADLEIQAKESGSEENTETRDLVKCLQVYFNLSPSEMFEDNVNSKQWTERPISRSTRLQATLFAVYLIILTDKQKKILLNDYYDELDNIFEPLFKAKTYTHNINFELVKRDLK